MTDLSAHGLVPLSEVAEELAHAARGLPLHNRDGTIRAFAMVDAADHERLAKYRWSVNRHGYVRRRGSENTYVLLHREILGLRRGDGVDADHLNRDRLDNRRSNLRQVTRQQNRQNTSGWKRNTTSKHRGVSWDEEREKWRAQGTVWGRSTCIGRFGSEQEAAVAAAAWRLEHMPYSNETGGQGG